MIPLPPMPTASTRIAKHPRRLTFSLLCNLYLLPEEHRAHPRMSILPTMRAGAGPSSVGTDLSATFRHPQRIDPHTGEALFSMEQVKDIVRRAVDEKERALREQYDRILSTKLQGAWRRPDALARSRVQPLRHIVSSHSLAARACRAIHGLCEIQRGLHLAVAQIQRLAILHLMRRAHSIKGLRGARPQALAARVARTPL